VEAIPHRQFSVHKDGIARADDKKIIQSFKLLGGYEGLIIRINGN